jgi:hypothetical protein
VIEDEWRVPAGDTRALAEALVRARSSEAGAAAARRGHELVVTLYNQASFKRKFAATLNSLVRR